MTSNRKDEMKVFAWCMFVLGLAFVVAASILSVCFRYDIPAGPDMEVTEEEQTITMESSKVSSSYNTNKPVNWRDKQVTVEYEAPKLTFLGTFVVTAYCACEECCEKSPDDPWYGITATGTKATQGRTIAVDPRVIPYGTVLYFDGHGGNFGGYIAEDCGGSIKGNRIDLYFDSHDEANEWGIKTRDIYIIE